MFAEGARSEPVKQPFEVLKLFLWAFALTGAAPNLIQKLAGPTIHILTLQQVLVRPDLTVGPSVPTQRIALLARIGAFRHSLLTLALLLLLGHSLAKIAHPLAQGFHCLGLVVDGTGKVILAQRFLSTLHGSFSPIQRLTRRIARLGPCSGQVLRLTVQFITQRALPLGKTVLKALAFAILPLPRLLPLTLLAGFLPGLLTLLPLLALLALLTLLARIELFLQIAERLI